MRASERLRDLHVRYETPFHEYGPDFGSAEEYGTVIKRVLPLIVDCIEMAENIINNNAYPDQLAVKLAALQGALEETRSEYLPWKDQEC